MFVAYIGDLYMKMVLTLLAAAAAAVSAPALAATTVLDFNGHSNTIYETPVVQSGFQLGNVAGDEQHFHFIDSTQFGLASNGTSVLLNDRNTSIFLRAANGSAFSLSSVDVAAAFNNSPATSLTISGFFNGLLTGSLTIANLGGFQTVATSGFLNVDRVVFDGLGGGGGFELDNVALSAASAVPEPATWAMMLLGFGLIGASLRTRRRSANVVTA